MRQSWTMSGVSKPKRRNTIPQSRFKTSNLLIQYCEFENFYMKSPRAPTAIWPPPPKKKGCCKFRDSYCNALEASNDRVTRWRRNGGTAALEASSYLSPKIPRSEADQLRKLTAPYLLSVVFPEQPQDFKRLLKAIQYHLGTMIKAV